MPGRLTVDAQKKLQLNFQLKGATTVHQAFVLLVHEPSGREIVYVAEPESGASKQYKFDLVSLKII